MGPSRAALRTSPYDPPEPRDAAPTTTSGRATARAKRPTCPLSAMHIWTDLLAREGAHLAVLLVLGAACWVWRVPE
jgi:hypothetical protein